VRGSTPAPTPPSDGPAPDRSEGRPAADDRPVLPDGTADERDLGWGESPEPDDDDRYLREVPPHHGS
jgi:hypothetical protein